MKFNRDVYFDGVRDTLFDGALEQIHVDGQNCHPSCMGISCWWYSYE